MAFLLARCSLGANRNLERVLTVSFGEKYKPKSLSSGIAGHGKAIATLQRLIKSPAFGPEYLLFRGPSGCGKTSMAECLALDLGCTDLDIERISGTELSIDALRLLEHRLSLASWGASGWRVVIVDEAHQIGARTIALLLPLIEHLPRKRVVCFTSTCDIIADSPDKAAFLSRCKVFDLKPDIELFACYLKCVAMNEGLDGSEIEHYKRMVKADKGNLRASLQRVEMGEFACSL